MSKLFKVKKYVSIIITLTFILALAPQKVFAIGSVEVMHSESNITSNSGVVNVSINYTNSGDYGKELYIEWRETNGSGPWDSLTLNHSKSNQPVNLSGLKENTRYDVRVLLKYYDAAQANDITLPEVYDYFTTKSNVSPVSVYNLVVAYGGGSSATAGAQYSAAPSVTTSNEGVVYSTTNTTPNFGEANTQIAYNNYGSGGIIAANMNNLTGTTYYVRAFVQYKENGEVKYEYSPVVTYNHTQQAAGAPTVVTLRATRMDNWINANGTIASSGSASLTEYGFVYSNTNTLPAIENSNKILGTFTTQNVNFEGSFSIYNYTSGIYYVRAYAVNKYGTSYGDVITVDLSQQNARVMLQSTDFVGSENAQFTIYVPSQGTASLIERGVVLSKQNVSDTPVIDGVNVIVVNADKETGSVKTGEIAVSVEKLDKSSKYYVRAYVKTNTGTYYSSDKGVLIETQAEEAIATLPATDITNTTAVVGGKISNNLDYTVRARGVVYSKTNTMPDITNSVYVQDTKTEMGEFTLSIKDLTPNTTYYVRAYYQTIQGYTYGSVRTFKTEENTFVKINDIINVKTNEATIKSNISAEINYNVTERGVVYSATQTTPIVNNSDYRTSETNGTGDFEITVTNLAPNTKYYVRAYAKTSQGYMYSQVKDLTTTHDVTIKINYRLSDGTVIGNEDITAYVNDVLTSENLKVPVGYKLESSGFKYTVTGSDSIIIVVVPEVKAETAYAMGAGNYTFQPSVAMTRIDVVKMIYNLLGEGKTYDSAVKFADMPSDFTSANAINFATSRGIISGYVEDNVTTFRPDRGITRAEFAIIIYKAYNLQPNNSVNVTLTDISSHWSRTYITVAVQNGIISGYEDNTFKPDRQVTRAEAVIMVSIASGRSRTPLGTMEFTDVPSSHWAYPYIMNAAIPQP